MARPSKDYEVFSGRICRDAAEKLKKINKETGLPKTAVVEKAINMFYEYYEKTGKVN